MYQVGQCVMVAAPHAEYAIAGVDSPRGPLVALTDGVFFEEGTFLLLATEATAWASSSGVQAGDTIVILR